MKAYSRIHFILLICLFFFSSLNAQVSVNAGTFQTIYLPSNQATLQAAISGKDARGNYQWRRISGPSPSKIISPSSLVTPVTNLIAGEYIFEFAFSSSHAIAKDSVSIVVYNTANQKVPPTDDYPNLFGANPGYYGPSWSDKQVYTMMAKAGCRSTRSTIPMFFFNYYGDSVRYPEFKYFFDTLGFRENVYFLYNIPGTDYPDQSKEMFNAEQAVVPKGLYLPIWNKDGSIDTSNTFANYCYKSVRVYGKFFKYFEIWNEPDFTGNWGAAGALPGNAGNWWENDPKPTDLYNLKAPAQYYIRMMRVAFEVIKRYKPEAVITLGGIGFPSFLHFVLRSTDNPEADKNGKKGSKTSAYPLTGGAYFDCLSFHSYPQFYLKFWDYTIGNMGYKRSSDEAIDQTIRDKKKFENILLQFGYDGKKLPLKPFICTEINIPRKQIQQDIGGIDVQRNFTWKTIAQSAKNGIKQIYWFVTAETADFSKSADGYKLMGLVKNVLATRPGHEELTEQGMANKSARLLLEDFFYDSAITRQLKLPPNIDGLAYRNKKTGETKFMLWAKTPRDLDETSEAYYSFPSTLVARKMNIYDASYAVSMKPLSTIEPTGIRLGGDPIILAESKSAARSIERRPHTILNISAGRDTIIHQAFIQLRGITSNKTTSKNIFYWDLVKVPPSQGDYPVIKHKDSLNPTVMGLQKGLYGIRLTVTDQLGNFSSDTVWVAVDTTVSFADNLPQIMRSQIKLKHRRPCFSDLDFFQFGEAIVSRNIYFHPKAANQN